MTVFNTDRKSHLTRNMFFDSSVDIVRYDTYKYKIFDTMARKQIGQMWRPEEVMLTRDPIEFKGKLEDTGRFIFTSNLKRQILLDSIQGRGPLLAFLPIVSLPELESFIQEWAYSEKIHNDTYTYILRSGIYDNPTEVFDTLLDITEIVDLAKDISKYYDELISLNNLRGTEVYEKYGLLRKHKEALWMCLNAVNALEGIRFYVSFACSWAFAENRVMEGNAKLIKFIARDENLHLSTVQHILKLLPKEDPEFAEIKRLKMPDVTRLIKDVVKQEKDWAKYVFSKGSIMGLNEKIACSFVEHRAWLMCSALGYPCEYTVSQDPLPWTQKWISGSEVQVAPQETEQTQYITGAIKKDLNLGGLKNFKL